jgi:hypothetical protein
MFLGALGFAMVTQTRNGELLQQRDAARNDAKTLRDQATLVADYIEDLGRVIGKPGKYEGRKGGVYGAASLTLPGVMNPDEIKAVMDKATKDAEVSIASGIENVLGALVTKVGQQAQRVRDVEAERDKVLNEKSEVDRKFQAAATEAANKAREYSQNNDQLRTDFAAANQDRDNRISQVQENLKSKVDELQKEREAATDRENELKKKNANLQNQNSALVSKDLLRRAPDVADGKILTAKNGLPTAFINLGRKDLLQAGVVFRVRAPNSSVVKGYAVVTRTEEERAEVQLYDFADPVANYAAGGDLIYNDFYTPRVTRTIFLLGRFSAPYHKPELTNLLTRLGNKVVDKMGPGVDTVILGNQPVNEAGDGFASIEEMPEYKLANELRVEFADLAKIRDLIKL